MSNYLAPYIGNGIVLKTPSTDGTIGQAITTNGAGNLGWSSVQSKIPGLTGDTNSITLDSPKVIIGGTNQATIDLVDQSAGDYFRIYGNDGQLTINKTDGAVSPTFYDASLNVGSLISNNLWLLDTPNGSSLKLYWFDGGLYGDHDTVTDFWPNTAFTDANYAKKATILTINGTGYDLSANRSWTVGTAWGAITGTLASQTDLNSALNARVPTSRTLTINGTAFDLTADRSWTVSGSMTVAGTGSELQYRSSGTALAAVTGSSVDGSGNVTLTTTISANLFLGTSGLYFALNSNGIFASSAVPIGFSSTTNPQGTKDVCLFRDAAATLAQRNGTNAQTFNLYGTFTDASNYRRLAITSTTAGAFTIAVQGLGTGASGNTFDIYAGGVRQFYLDTNFVQVDSRLTVVGNTGCHIKLGGTNNTFPGLKRSSTTIQARLADDSAFGSIQGKITTDTAYTAGVVTDTGTITLYDSTGTAYRVLCAL